MLFLLLLSAFLAPQAAADGGAPGAFLRQDVGARGAALSGAFGALADDASSIYWNPSGLARLAKPEVSATHVILYEDTSLDMGVGAFPVPQWGSFGVGYLRQNSGNFDARAGPLGAPNPFSITQTAFMAGWGRAVGLFSFPLRAGVAFKSEHETIASAGASGWGADIGMGAQPLPRVQLGLLVQNLVAPRLTFVSEPQTYPRMVDVSGAYSWGPQNGIHAVTALRLNTVAQEGTTVAGGLELWQDALAAVRVGGSSAGWSAGFGVKLANVEIDYAAQLRDLGNAHQVSLRLLFGQTKEELEALIRTGIQRFTRDEARRLARAYVRSSDEALAESNYSKAVSDLESAQLWDPADPEIAAKLERLLARVEETVRRQIIERTSLLAQEQFDRGNWIASQSHWRSVLDLDPDNARAREALGGIDRFLAERAQKEQAQRSAELARREDERTQAAAFLKSGEQALAAGRYREAAQQAVNAIKRIPELPEAQELRARAEAERVKAVRRHVDEGARFLEAKAYPKAIEEFNAALSDDARNVAAREGVARAREAMRAPLSEDAQKQIEKTYYLAVDAYLKSDYRAARRHIDDIFKLEPSDENALKLKERLDAASKLEAK